MTTQTENIQEVNVKPVDKAKIQKIWKVAGILAIVTAIEFVMAFTLPRGTMLTILFVLLTVVKAFYIVAEFMHLKHEVKTLIYSVVIPMIFVVWLLIALLVEGGSLFVAASN